MMRMWEVGSNDVRGPGQNAWGHLAEVIHTPRSDTRPGSPWNLADCSRS